MIAPPLRVERRVGQRFPYLLAVSLRDPATSVEGVGCTQDLSSRGFSSSLMFRSTKDPKSN